MPECVPNIEPQPGVAKPKMRLIFEAKCNTDNKIVREHWRKTNARHYPRVTWGVLLYDTCAVVGGGPGLKYKLDVLRKWKGDIFAVNDTAGFLSDEGIPCYMYAIDCDSTKQWKSGPLVKGAVFASRVSQFQMKRFSRKKIRIFDMAEEDGVRGIEGGPTAACRAPHLFLRMGYRGIVYFGCDGSFYEKTHVTPEQKVAYSNMMIVRVNGIEYLTNAALYLQSQYLIDVLYKFPKFLYSASGGLLEAMYNHPNDWEVVAIADDLRQEYIKGGVTSWTKPHDTSSAKFWTPDPSNPSEAKPPQFMALGEIPKEEEDKWQLQRKELLVPPQSR